MSGGKRSIIRDFRRYGRYVRTALYLYPHRKHFKQIGKGLVIAGSIRVPRGEIYVGDYCFINAGCYLSGNIRMGNFVMLASQVAIVGGDHNTNIPGVPMRFSGRDRARQVRIADDVWIGHGAIILCGVSIGEGAVIGAGSVVTSSVDEYAIVAGVPAEFVRRRFADEQILEHQHALADYRKSEKRYLPQRWRQNN